MKIILDFDGLDGSLSVTAGIRNATEGAVAGPGIAGHGSVALVESEPHTDIEAVTESVAIQGDTSQIAFDDLDFTEPVLDGGDTPSVAEPAVNAGESTQTESSDLDITVPVPLHPEAFKGDFFDTNLPKQELSPEPFFKRVGDHHRPSGRSRRTLSLIGAGTVFLIGLLSGAGILYWWNADDVFNPGLSREAEGLAAESAYTNEPAPPAFTDAEPIDRLPLVADMSGFSTSRSAELSEPVNTSPPSPPSAAQAQMELHEPSSVPENIPFPPNSSPNQEAPAAGEKSGNEVYQGTLNSNRQQNAGAWTIPFLFSELKVRVQTVKNTLPLLSQCDGVLVITGHTCSLGRTENNYYVGLARAKSVRETLIKLGVSAARLRVDSAGDEQPVATNDTKDGRQENRRAVIHCRME